MAIHKYILRRCPKCEKETKFKPVLRYVDYNGIIHCWKCQSCKTVCPAYSFGEFISTGKIIIGV